MSHSSTRRRILAAALAAATIAAGAMFAAAPVGATTVRSGLGGYSALIVDQAHDRLFESGPASSDTPAKPGGVMVEGLTGKSRSAVPGVTATGPMAMAPDGSAVFVAGLQDVEAIDTGTLAVTDYPIGSVGCLTSLAATTGYVWFTYGCDTSNDVDNGLASIDLSDGTVSIDLQPSTMFGALMVTSVAATPNSIALLAAGDTVNDTHTRLTMLSVDSGNPENGPIADLGQIYGQALTLTSDGATVAAGGTGLVREYTTASLTLLRSISLDTPHSAQGQATNGIASSLAYNPDGAVLAVTGSFGEYRSSRDGAYGAVVRTYRAATGALVRQYDYRQYDTDTTVINVAGPQSVVWVGATLWATFVNYLGERPTSHLLTNAVQSPSTVALTGPRTAVRGKAITLSGTVTSAGAGVPNAVLTVTCTDLDGSHTLHAIRADSAGRFSLRDQPTVGAQNTFAVTYAGDATRSAATGHTVVAVSRVPPALTVRTDRASYVSGHVVHVVAHLGTTYRNRAVTIRERQYPNKYTVIRTAEADRHGDVTARFKVASRVTVEAVFAGDERYLPRAVATTRPVKARVVMAVSHPYRRHGAYHYFHRKSGAILVGRVVPKALLNDVTFTLQVHYKGKWRTVDSQSFDTNSAGRTDHILLTAAARYPYRVRALSGGAQVNSTIVVRESATPWYYLKFA